MKLQRVEVSEDERAELLTQHQQRVERYREEKRLNVRPGARSLMSPRSNTDLWSVLGR
jgi:hypothetical protein